MTNQVPYEVVGTPCRLYIAPVGSPPPNVWETPSAPWALVGSNGFLNYDSDAGLVVGHPQGTNKWRSLGDTLPRKIFPTEEDRIFRILIADLTLEQYSHVLNGNQVRAVPSAGPGTASVRRIGLSRGTTILNRALVVRLMASPYGEVWSSQWVIPVAAQLGASETTIKRDTPALLQLEWHALVDPNAARDDESAGWFEAQDQDEET